jgi:hypothetical protein
MDSPDTDMDRIFDGYRDTDRISDGYPDTDRISDEYSDTDQISNGYKYKYGYISYIKSYILLKSNCILFFL